MKLTKKEIEMIKNAINCKLIHLIGEMKEYVELYEKIEREGR